MSELFDAAAAARALGLAGRVVAVTGGSRGVGAGVVRAFLEAGCVVETCGRTTPDDLPEVDGRTPHFTEVDVRDADQVAAWMAGIEERHGRLDVLVNNAGGAPLVDFSDSSVRLLTKVLELNLTSAILVTHAAAPLLADGGVVLSITSLSGRRGSPGSAVYGAAKAGLDSLTASLAMEWAPRVRVNALSCGHIATEGAQDHYGLSEEQAAVAATIPRGRLAAPAEIGHTCLLLASPLAAHVTGAVLNVDGGGEWPAFLHRSTPPQPQEQS